MSRECEYVMQFHRGTRTLQVYHTIIKCLQCVCVCVRSVHYNGQFVAYTRHRMRAKVVVSNAGNHAKYCASL